MILSAYESLLLTQKLKKVSLLLGIIIICSGVLAIIQWMNNSSLKSTFYFNEENMRLNSAFSFVLCGISIILLNRAAPSKIEKGLIFCMSLLIIIVAAIAIFQYAPKVPAYAAEKNGDGDSGGIFYRMMSTLESAVCFMLIGFSMLLTPISKESARLYQWLAIAVGFYAFLTLIGYLFGAINVAGNSYFGNMSFLSAVSFFILVIALLFINPEFGIMKAITVNTMGGSLFRTVFPLMIFLILFFGRLRLEGELNGLYDNRHGVALYTILIILIIAFAFYYSAVKLNKSEYELLSIQNDLLASQKEIQDFKYALDQSSIVSITDQNGIIEHVNDNFCKISKYSREELLGQDHRIINSGHHSKAFFRDLWETIGSGKIWRNEIKNKAKDGSFYWVDITIVPFCDEQGKPFKYAALRVDINERKNAEEQVLLRAKEYQTINKELEAFTYSVSHDLRSPLRAVNSYAQILLEDYAHKIDEDGISIIESIRYNGQKMGNLIDELLAFSKLGRKEIAKTDVNMNELTEAVLREVSVAFPHHAKIAVGTLPVVATDYTLMYQVMFNLVSNALKYSGKKTAPVIEISAAEKNGKTCFVVKDNGAGFDMRFADKLFGVFQRLHAESDFEGNGVGLAIVHRIVTKFGGEIWAEGKVHEGAVFYFTIN